ncbi:hypothetical protein GTA08_BOTSDO04824 [Botryosphaeria dothidea]|uniref:Uncharacterized protein n=1 Tax=Botryosphaeria dothidea TaxID=55169 RepID=A0A8H4IWU0_9PEZI|nr:hypothetical protein GTA08_BOTSDO04824 [Botryosphaeria dothidea]
MSLTAASLFTHAPQPEIVENIAIAPAPILPLRAIPHIENKPLSADAASVLDDIQQVLLGVETDVVGGQIVPTSVQSQESSAQSTAQEETSTDADHRKRSHVLDATYGGLTPPSRPGDALPKPSEDAQNSRGNRRSDGTGKSSHVSSSRRPAGSSQASYDTSTAVDPTTWSHIPDPTYGGLTPPPRPTTSTFRTEYRSIGTA